MWCRTGSMTTRFFPFRPLDADFFSLLLLQKLTNTSSMKCMGVMAQRMCGSVAQCSLSMNHMTVWDIHFLVLVSCVGGRREKRVSLHESLVMCNFLSVFLLNSPPSFCRCALVVWHPLFLSLSLSPLAPSVLQSHDREETLGQTLTSDALRPFF